MVRLRQNFTQFDRKFFFENTWSNNKTNFTVKLTLNIDALIQTPEIFNK